ncbi:hypothetical protein AAVH_17295 [Aphelenchoides avenae]|nr:hypothetical protein AAVH_17295 [Aphelenchus avenae]
MHELSFSRYADDILFLFDFNHFVFYSVRCNGDYAYHNATVTPTTASVKPSTTPSTPKTTKKPAPSALKTLKYLPGVCRNPSPQESAKCTAACKKQGLKSGACVKLVPPPRLASLRSFICFCF